MIIIMIIMIALKGAIRAFYNIFTAPQTVTNTHAQIPGRSCVQITYNTSNAYHVQRVVCYVVGRDSSATKFVRI